MIYFDNAATTLRKPPEVAEAMVASLNTLGNSGRSVHESSLDSARVIFNTRNQLARLFNISNSQQIAFTCNATESLNIAIKGLINPKDQVITTVLEHNSVLRPLYEMEEKGTTLTIISADNQGIIDYQLLEQSLRSKKTNALIITHASNLTGNVIDLEKVGQLTHDTNTLLVVDASQTAGVMPIDVVKMNIDVLCFTGHKGLLGPQGTGGIYVREGLDIRPFKSGGTGIETYNKKQPMLMPTHLEAGTLNGHGLAGLNAALGYIQTVGTSYIYDKEQQLMSHFYKEIRMIEGLTIYGDFSNFDRSPIVSLNIGTLDSSEVSDQLYTDYDIATRSGGHCAPLMHKTLGTIEQGAVRFSFSHYNTISEVNRAVFAIKQISTALLK